MLLLLIFSHAQWYNRLRDVRVCGYLDWPLLFVLFLLGVFYVMRRWQSVGVAVVNAPGTTERLVQTEAWDGLTAAHSPTGSGVTTGATSAPSAPRGPVRPDAAQAMMAQPTAVSFGDTEAAARVATTSV